MSYSMVNWRDGIAPLLIDGLPVMDRGILDATNRVPINAVQDHGVVGGDTGDQGAAINAATAAAAAGGGGAVFLPRGMYRYTTALIPQANVLLFGEGPSTILHYAGTGTSLQITNFVGARYKDLVFLGTASTFTLVGLSQSFDLNFSGVTFQGTHSTTTPQATQRGIDIRANAGDNYFTDCKWYSLGEPVVTDSIQNYISQSHFGGCRNGLIGDPTSRITSGMSVSNTTFATTASVNNLTHVDVRGPGSNWSFANCWFEGADKSFIVGRTGVGGPASFNVVNCHVASTTTNFEMQACNQPSFVNIGLDSNGSTTPTNFDFPSPGGVSKGAAINLLNLIGAEIPTSIFPADWFVFSRSTVQVPFAGINIGGLTNVQIGSNSPEGTATANPGGQFLNVATGGGSPLYLKQSGAGTNTGWKAVPLSLVSADRGDASVTLAITDAPTQRFATALTANRTVTLPPSQNYNGARFRIVRTGLGAFTLDVGGLKTIPASTAAWVDVERDDTAWRLSGYGTL